MSLQLTERQRMTIAAAITVLATFIIVLAAGALIFLLGLFFSNFSNVFLPVAVAGVLALVLKPYYDWLCTKLRLPRILALLAIFLSLLIPFVALGWFFGSLIVDQLTDLISHLPEWYEKSAAWLGERWPKVVTFWNEHPWGQKLQQATASGTEEFLAGLQLFGGKALSAGAGALRGLGALFSWVVLPVYLAFFLMMRSTSLSSRDFLPFLKPETRDDVTYLGTEFINIIVSFFRGQLLIALLQGVLFAIGFSLVGLRWGFILGLVLGFLNIIPYLGSIIGLAVCLPLAFFQPGGGLVTTLAVMIVFVAVQMIEGYVLTPKIMGDRTGLHPMVIMIAIFFWGSALDGITGMILAIPLTAFLVIFWRLARDKYISELM